MGPEGFACSSSRPQLKPREPMKPALPACVGVAWRLAQSSFKQREQFLSLQCLILITVNVRGEPWPDVFSCGGHQPQVFKSSPFSPPSAPSLLCIVFRSTQMC